MSAPDTEEVIEVESEREREKREIE